MPEPPFGAIRSPDGAHWWDGTAWKATTDHREVGDREQAGSRTSMVPSLRSTDCTLTLVEDAVVATFTNMQYDGHLFWKKPVTVRKYPLSKIRQLRVTDYAGEMLLRICPPGRERDVFGHLQPESEVEGFCASIRKACPRHVDMSFTKIGGGRHTEPPTNWAAITVAHTPDRPTFCREAADFEAAAAYWMQAWGYAGAVVTSRGPDGGADVVAIGAVAQVKAWMAPVGRPYIQQLRGVAHGDREALFFSLSGYTAEARRWAEEAQVALFRFSGLDGSVEALNSRAVAIVEARSISP